MAEPIPKFAARVEKGGILNQDDVWKLAEAVVYYERYWRPQLEIHATGTDREPPCAECITAVNKLDKMTI